MNEHCFMTSLDNIGPGVELVAEAQKSLPQGCRLICGESFNAGPMVIVDMANPIEFRRRAAAARRNALERAYGVGHVEA